MSERYNKFGDDWGGNSRKKRIPQGLETSKVAGHMSFMLGLVGNKCGDVVKG